LIQTFFTATTSPWIGRPREHLIRANTGQELG
jgi:hypothetical protein